MYLIMGICSGISMEWLSIHCFQIDLEFGVLFFVEGGKPEKNPQNRDENQQQAQPTCDTVSGNRTRATAVGGERSHHCAIPAPLIKEQCHKDFAVLGQFCAKIITLRL